MATTCPRQSITARSPEEGLPRGGVAQITEHPHEVSAVVQNGRDAEWAPVKMFDRVGQADSSR